MGRLIFSPLAMQDLKDIYNYIKNDALTNAKKVRKAITDECKKLLRFPEIGREIIKTPEDSIRQILVYKYRILGDDVEIISIYHSSRLLENNPGLQRYFK